MDTFSELLPTIALVLLIALVIFSRWGLKKRRERLRVIYSNALKGNDVNTALNTGREYYNSLRGNNKLTIYDEQAIANDLKTMSKD